MSTKSYIPIRCFTPGIMSYSEKLNKLAARAKMGDIVAVCKDWSTYD